MNNQTAHFKNNIANTIFYAVMLLACFVIIVPIVFIIISSFKTETQIFAAPWSLPETFQFSTYIEIFKNYNMGNYFVNSIFYAVSGCAICLALTFPASYALCRMRFKSSKLLMAYLVSGLMIPIHAILVPLYITTSKLQISNKVALVLIYAASTMPTALFLFVGNLKSIPISIEEAAIIDGCSIPQMLVKIIIPMSRSIAASVTMFSLLNIWNDLMLALVFLSNELDKTIQVGIMRFVDSYFTNYGFLLSAIVVTIIPTIIVFAFLSKQIVSGMTAGAVKE